MEGDLLSRPYVRPAKFWTSVRDRPGYVRCSLCHRRCVIAPQAYGVCGVRRNMDGSLYTLVYGLLTAANLDPIEKKPLMHFMPGSYVFSIATVGCNFFCKFCQNWEISQSRLEKGLYGHYVSPERAVDLAISHGANGISYTYNEPTVFYEYMYDVAKLARGRGLFNTMVTNGYITPQALEELAPYMDAATVDFKGSGNRRFYRDVMGVPDPEPIFETLLVMKERGVFVEITNLIVPEVGDKEEDTRRLAGWVAENLGPETPFHLLRFYPQYKMVNVSPTDVRTLEKHARIAKEEGLEYVYIGNVWGHPMESTYCPSCGTMLVRRLGFELLEWRLTDGNRCLKCGRKINIIGSPKRSGKNILIP